MLDLMPIRLQSLASLKDAASGVGKLAENTNVSASITHGELKVSMSVSLAILYSVKAKCM